jgi:LPXTG-motif cell wall-anchored protein
MDNPPPTPKPKKAIQAEASGMDDMMMLGAVGVLVVGIAAIVIVRKRKQQKEMAAVFNENTQIGA